MGRSIAAAVHRKIHRERRDAVALQGDANGVCHALLPRSEAVQQERCRNGIVCMWQQEYARKPIVTIADVDIVAHARRHVARRADLG
jgi:hypothetical protein